MALFAFGCALGAFAGGWIGARHSCCDCQLLCSLLLQLLGSSCCLCCYVRCTGLLHGRASMASMHRRNPTTFKAAVLTIQLTGRAQVHEPPSCKAMQLTELNSSHLQVGARKAVLNRLWSLWVKEQGALVVPVIQPALEISCTGSHHIPHTARNAPTLLSSPLHDTSCAQGMPWPSGAPRGGASWPARSA